MEGCTQGKQHFWLSEFPGHCFSTLVTHLEFWVLRAILSRMFPDQ